MKRLSAFATRLCQLIGIGTLSDESFNELALELFALQLEHNAAYRTLCGGSKAPQSWADIPAVPTAAFKELEMTCIPPAERIKEFRSSGTME